MVNIALTGGTGFAGRCFIDLLLQETDWHIHSFQRRALSTISDSDRLTIWPWNIRDPFPFYTPKIDLHFWVHLGAEVHALRSLKEPEAFLHTNAMGTLNALEVVRYSLGHPLFAYISTAEVLGGNETGYSEEDDPLRPSNPYAASKAAGELLVQTYHRCFGLRTIIARAMNLYDMVLQNDESKFVPMVKKAILTGERVKIHTKDGKPGMRQWMTGRVFSQLLLNLLQCCTPGQTYHLVGEELTNLEMAQRVADSLDMTLKYDLVPMPKTHEWRYAMRSTR